MLNPERSIIRTPDQRLRVFVSSTLQELAEERDAAREAITSLHLAPVMFELGARPHPPRDLYRAYLEQSHVFIGIYWQRYGWVAPGETISGLEDEYQLSNGKPKLIYVKRPSPEIESRLKDLLTQIQRDDRVSYKPFTTAAELRELIENDLALLLTERFEAAGKDRASPAENPRRHNLPASPTGFIGREQELKALRELLRSREIRLVTLIGPGGVGKTRLGLQVAADVLDDFEDGVFFVPLASIREGTLVPPAIAHVLGLRETSGEPLFERVKDYLGSKHLLMLFDGMEQVVSAAPLVAELLASCPGLKVLVTSRAPLHIRGETEFPVAPLALPDSKDHKTPEELERYEAIRLFVQRARQVSPDFALTKENARTVSDICRRLDGLPLAIELAAARIKVLSPEALLARLDSRLTVLTGGARDLPARQQTLRSTIEWSYELLEKQQQLLFRRMAVFAGGCTLKAAKEVCDPTGDLGMDVLEGVTALLDESLVRRDEVRGIARFAMLETIREYALERLVESGEAETVRQKHAEFFLALAAQVDTNLRSGDRATGLEQAEAEHDNWRSALTWSRTEGSGEIGLKLAGALWWFWYFGGYWSEGRSWLAGALARPDNGSPAVRAQALLGAGVLAGAHGDVDLALRQLQESIAKFREADDRFGLAYGLNFQGAIMRWHGDSNRARAILKASVDLFRKNGDKWGLALALSFLSETLMILGQYDEAQSRAQESVAISRELADKWGLALSLSSLGLIARQKGDDAEACTFLEESVALFRKLGDKSYSGLALIYLGDLARRQADYERAAALYEESLALYREIGSKWGVALPLQNLGRIALLQGDFRRAEMLLKQSLPLYRAADLIPGVAVCLEGLAAVAMAEKQPERAAQLLGAAQALLDRTHTLLEPVDRSEFEREMANARSQLGKAKFASAWAEGQSMTLEQAIAPTPQEASRNEAT